MPGVPNFVGMVSQKLGRKYLVQKRAFPYSDTSNGQVPELAHKDLFEF